MPGLGGHKALVGMAGQLLDLRRGHPHLAHALQRGAIDDMLTASGLEQAQKGAAGLGGAAAEYSEAPITQLRYKASFDFTAPRVRLRRFLPGAGVVDFSIPEGSALSFGRGGSPFSRAISAFRASFSVVRRSTASWGDCTKVTYLHAKSERTGNAGTLCSSPWLRGLCRGRFCRS